MYIIPATNASVFQHHVTASQSGGWRKLWLWPCLWLMILAAGCASRPIERTPLPLIPTSTRQPLPINTAPAESPTATPTVKLTPPQAASTAPKPTVIPEGACAPLTANGAPRYVFNVIADPQARRLQVQQQVGLADGARLATGAVVFNVPANAAAGVFTLERARLAGSAQPLTGAFDGTALRLSLPEAARMASEVTLCLDYSIALPRAGGEGISAVHALGWSDLGLVAGYWYPVLAPYTRAQGWFLVPYHPVGDPIVYEVADYEAVIRAPASYTVIGAGLQKSDGGTWRFKLERARGFAFAVSDRLVASRAEVNGLPLQVWHLPAHQSGAAAALRAVHEALPLFDQTYGPYPYRELVIIEAVQFGGMEYSALITFSRDWFADYAPPPSGVDFGADLLVRFIVHELGHQWWYGAVGNDQVYEPWLDEALARYGEVLYYEQLHPTHLAWWEAPSTGMTTAPINQAIYRFADTASYVQAIYVSGTRFLLAVRQQIGAQAFTAFLQDYFRRYRNGFVSQIEFLTLLKNYTGPTLSNLLPIYFNPLPKLAP